MNADLDGGVKRTGAYGCDERFTVNMLVGKDPYRSAMFSKHYNGTSEGSLVRS